MQQTSPTEPPRHIQAQHDVVLKPPEPQMSLEQPWQDDKLAREDFGKDLTEIVRNEKSITVSLHGGWGTGKTFFLQRWQQDLENQGKKAVYFNAWENDFADDPLAAITLNLAEQLRGSTLEELAQALAEAAMRFLILATEDIIRSSTGFKISARRFIANLLGTEHPPDPFTARKRTLDTLKDELAKLSQGVREETGFPLVFIIDELDRCRPDFAISLLERVKHVLSAPDMAFVLGINRTSLAESISARYGIIDAEGYLSRFFDLPLNMPSPDDRGLDQLVAQRTHVGHRLRAQDEEAAENRVARTWDHAMRTAELRLSELCSALSLPLRDIQRCTTLLALAGKNLESERPAYAEMLGIMTVLKVKSPKLYDRYIHRECSAGEVMDQFDHMGYRNNDELAVIRTEAALYAAEGIYEHEPALAELRLLAEGQPPSNPKMLSTKTREGTNATRLEILVQQTELLSGQWKGRQVYIPGYLSTLIDLYPRLEELETGDKYA